MRGAVAVSAELGGLTVTQGEDILATYTFNTGVAKHHFCSRCGIYTHHQRRSNPRQYGVNLACLEGMSPFDLEEVPVLDGEPHPSDTGRSRMAGVLRFVTEGLTSGRHPAQPLDVAAGPQGLHGAAQVVHHGGGVEGRGGET